MKKRTGKRPGLPVVLLTAVLAIQTMIPAQALDLFTDGSEQAVQTPESGQEMILFGEAEAAVQDPEAEAAFQNPEAVLPEETLQADIQSVQAGQDMEIIIPDGQEAAVQGLPSEQAQEETLIISAPEKDETTDTAADLFSAADPQTGDIQTEAAPEDIIIFDSAQQSTETGTEETGTVELFDPSVQDGLTPEELEEELAPFDSLVPMEALPEPEESSGLLLTAPVAATALPAKYDSRAAGYVTVPKNQLPFKNCWAFSMASVLETSLLMQGLGAYDLSEEHLSYFFANRENDPLGNTAGDRNKLVSTSANAYQLAGGNMLMGALHLSSWAGMALESQVPSPTDETHTRFLPTTASAGQCYLSSAHLTDAVFSGATSTALLKTLIYNYGSVGISLNMDKNYYNAATHAFSYPNTTTTVTHAVTLVGWDNSYDKGNFPETSNVTRDGAFIAKNSWGESWGEEGYFYISYESKSLYNAMTGKAELSPAYPNNYFYDGTAYLGTGNALALSSDSASETNMLANVFQVKAGGSMAEALGEVVVADYTSRDTYGVQVYTNLTDLSDPTSGTPVFSSPVAFYKEYAGVATFRFDEEIVLAGGSWYSVVLTNLGSGSIQYFQDTSGLVGGWLNTVSENAECQSFRYDAGSEEWLDLSLEDKNFGTSGCARIKAHTRTLGQAVALNTAVSSVDLTTGDKYALKCSVSGGITKYGLTWTSSDTGVATVSSSGVITARKAGTATVSVRMKGTSLEASCRVTVKAIPATSSITAAGTAYNTIQVKWKAVSPADGYALYRREGTGSWKRLGYLASTKTAYTDSTVKLGIIYQYRIQAYRNIGTTKYAGKYSSIVKAKAAALKAPTVTARTYSGLRKAVITWTKTAGASGYAIYRKIGSGTYKRIATVKSSASRKYVDKYVRFGKKYTYRIRAFRTVDGKNYYGAIGTSKTVKVSK